MCLLIVYFMPANSDTLDSLVYCIYSVENRLIDMKVSDSITTHTNKHLIETLTWAASILVGRCR